MACPPEDSPDGSSTVDATHPACLPNADLIKACDVQRTRRGGPGGQHRNKVETAIRLTHRPTVTVAEASERRSQAQNLAMATFRLRVKLALNVRYAWSQPSDLWQSRAARGRLTINEAHADLPAILAETLDALATHHGHDANTAAALNLSRSQLLKFWKRDGSWLDAVNRLRATHGLPPLH